MIWQLTNIMRCRKRGCGYTHEYDILPEDDTCPKCKKAGLWRQVMEDNDHIADYNPRVHVRGDST